MSRFTQTDWRQYCEAELVALTPILQNNGYALASDQPHLKGERFLQQAVSTTSGRKLILLGQATDQTLVVIKASREAGGQAELRHERRCRETLNSIDFAAETFRTPPEIDWIEIDNFVISIQLFIEQSSTFLDRPLCEQFDYALKAFTSLSGSHATTYKHQKLIGPIYKIRQCGDYIKQATRYQSEIPDQSATLQSALNVLISGQEYIEQYADFLTHTDFVPHNFRIDTAGTMYLLDYSSLTFGNKHEGWARFMNFMELYNPPLTAAFTTYVQQNKSEEEQTSLHLMRIYRLSELIWYYQNKLPGSEGNLLKLNQLRVVFWTTVLKHVLSKDSVPESVINTYKTERDQLRSDEEKERQQGLH